MTAVRLEDVEAAVLQVREELEDRAVALPGRERDGFTKPVSTGKPALELFG